MNTTTKTRILHAIFRPILHVSVEIFSFFVIVFFVTIGASVAVLLATAMTSYVTKNSGISGTLQETVVVIAVACTMIYALFAEAQKARRLLKMWTDHIHKQINNI